MGVVVEYDSNNSGGSWWLNTEHWLALEKAGWNVHWVQPERPGRIGPGRSVDTYKNPMLPQTMWPPDVNWLGARARSAAKEFDDPSEAIPEWERVTGLDASAYGCSCCGPPHNFEFTDEDGNTHYASARIVETEIDFN